MATGGPPLVTIALRDGNQLAVTNSGIVVGDRSFELARIQDARQVSPNPETYALRVSGVGLVEFQPVEQGAGTVALEALFRLRPDLRPAGFNPPANVPPGFPPAQQMPPAPVAVPYAGASHGYPPPPYPPYGAAPGASPMAPRWMNPNASQGEITPYPRTFGEILSAAFQLYGKHFRSWALMGIAVAFIPNMFVGLAQVVPYLLLRENPWGSAANLPATNTSLANALLGTASASALTNQQMLIVGGFAAAAVLLVLLFQAWQIASFAQAGREALFGRPVRAGASLAGGLRRFLPVLGAQILLVLAVIVIFAPAIALLVAGLATIGPVPTTATATTQLTPAQTTGALLSCAGFIAGLIGAIAGLFIYFRLVMGPFMVSADRTGIFASFRRGWRISRGHWWRIVGAVVIVTLVIGLGGVAVSELELVSLGITLLVITPLYQAIVTPLLMLTYLTLLYDLRLRSEGYTALQQEYSQQAVSQRAFPKEG